LKISGYATEHNVTSRRPDDMAKMAAASLIHTRINYANSLIHGYTNVKKLQRVQTSAARLALPNLTALLSELHWLPVTSRITFKLACLTHKLLTTGQPAYLCTLLHHYTATCTPRSTNQFFLDVP